MHRLRSPFCCGGSLSPFFTIFLGLNSSSQSRSKLVSLLIFGLTSYSGYLHNIPSYEPRPILDLPFLDFLFFLWESYLMLVEFVSGLVKIHLDKAYYPILALSYHTSRDFLANKLLVVEIACSFPNWHNFSFQVLLATLWFALFGAWLAMEVASRGIFLPLWRFGSLLAP